MTDYTKKEPFDTADVVKHEPSGETWYLAYCRNGYVCACGWPCSEAKASDCTLVKKGTAEEREDLLRRLAEPRGDYDPRTSYAQHIFYERATSMQGAGI